MPRTALVVPVPEAAAYYDALVGVPAHVTVLFPFLDPQAIDEAEVARVLSRFDAFAFELVSVESFADGTRWLRPDPMEPFVALTTALWERWPDHPPYGGVYETVVPHLTFTAGEPQLPVAAHAGEVRLLEESDDGSWTTRRSFPLQGVA